MRPIVQFGLYFIAGFLQLLLLLFIWGVSAGSANAWPYILLVAFLGIGLVASALSLFFEKPGALAAVLGGIVGLCWPVGVFVSENPRLDELAMMSALPLLVTLDGFWRLFHRRATAWFKVTEGPNLLLRATLGTLPFVVVGVMAFPLMTATKVTFVMSDGYMGKVGIVFTPTQNTRKTEEEGGAKTYDVPGSGVVLTSGKPVHGWTRTKYFYRKTDGSLHPIDTVWNTTIHDTNENRVDPTIGIYFRGSGISGSADCRFEYETFIVGTKRFILDSSARPSDDFNRHMQEFACGTARVK